LIIDIGHAIAVTISHAACGTISYQQQAIRICIASVRIVVYQKIYIVYTRYPWTGQCNIQLLSYLKSTTADTSAITIDIYIRDRIVYEAFKV